MKEFENYLAVTAAVLVLGLILLSPLAVQAQETSRVIPFNNLATSLEASTTQSVTAQLWDVPSGGTTPLFAEGPFNTLIDDNRRISFNFGAQTPGGLDPANFPSGTSRFLDVVDPATGLSVLTGGRIPLNATPFALSPGPQGPAGPAGPTGPQGPPGPVNSVTAGDNSISIGGSVANPTIAVNAITNANVANGALSPAKIAGIAATLGANAFFGDQSVTGNVSASGSLSGNTASFSGNLTGSQLLSTVATGTPPLVVNSTTQVPNLNASLLGGLPSASYAQLAAARNSFTGNQSLLALGTATPSGGFSSAAHDQIASAFNSTSGAAQDQRFLWQADALGNNTPNPSGQLSLLFGSGSAPPAPTGLAVKSDGTINFASGQSFPGSVSGVSAGDASIAIGGTPSAPTVAVANSGISDAKISATAAINPAKIAGTAATLGANTFTGNQSVTGNVSASGSLSGNTASFSGNLTGSQLLSTVATGTPPLVVNSTTQVPNLNASLLGGLPSASYAHLAAANTFTGNQVILANPGNVFIGGSASVLGVSLTTPGIGATFEALGVGPAQSHIHFGPTGDWFIRSASPSGKVILQDTGGNVGIGTGSPVAKLDIVGNGRDILLGDPGCGAGFAGIGFAPFSNCLNYSLIGNGTHTFLNRPAGGNLAFREGNGDQMVIAPGGNVGIGTSSPATKLDVNGTVRATGFNTSTDFVTTNPGSGIIVKSPNGLRCARIGIDNNGNLAVTPGGCPLGP